MGLEKEINEPTLTEDYGIEKKGGYKIINKVFNYLKEIIYQIEKRESIEAQGKMSPKEVKEFNEKLNSAHS